MCSSFASRISRSQSLEKRCHLGTRLGVTGVGDCICRRKAIVVLRRNRGSIGEIVSDGGDGGGGGGGDETPEFVGRATPRTSMKRTHTRAKQASKRAEQASDISERDDRLFLVHTHTHTHARTTHARARSSRFGLR